MIVKTKNPIEYQDKNTTNIETRGGYDGEDVGGFVSFEGEEFVPFDGETELETFLGADGEIYHYSFNNDEYYNAKGQKVKDAFKAIGKGIGKGAKAVFGKDGFIRKNIRNLKDKIVGRIKKIPENVKKRMTERQANRQKRKDARKLVQTEKKHSTREKEVEEFSRKQAEKMEKQRGAEQRNMNEGKGVAAPSPSKSTGGSAGEPPAGGAGNPNQLGGVAAPSLSRPPAGAAAGTPPLGGAGTTQQQQQQQQQQPIQDESNFKLPLKVADANTPEENKIIYQGVTYNDEGFHNAVEFLQGANGGKGMFVLNVPPKDVVAVTAEDGKVDYYQKKDFEGEGMTLTTKILIGVGAVVALGLITFLIIKRKK